MDMVLPVRTDSDIPPGALYHGKRVTRQEYLNLEDDGFLYDMIDGVLYMPPSADFEHGHSYGKFFVLLALYLKKHPRGRATQETDILLPDGGDILRPDLCFILTENLHIVKKHVHGTPDLVCEALSDSTAERDLGEKADRYLANGVAEYWIVDPRDRTLQCWINAKDRWIKHAGEKLESKLLPGFVVSAEDIFD